MSAHELLGIPSLEDLKKMNDERLKKAYDNKVIELNDIRVIELAEFERRQKELKDAFELLKTADNRLAYIQQLTQPQTVMNSVKTKEATLTLPVTATLPEVNKSVETYRAYIDTKIHSLDKSDINYIQKKEKLESEKKSAEPKEVNYSSFEDFQKSECYQSMPKEDQSSYSTDNYPSKTVSVTLTFDSCDEALNYIKTNMGVEVAQKLAKQMQEKGHNISPEVLEELRQDEQEPHYQHRRRM